MFDFEAEDFAFGNDRRGSKAGDWLKHFAWIIPLFVFGLILALCVDYALQSKDREDYSTEVYMQELEGRVTKALTWSTYAPTPERDETRPSHDPLLRLIAPEIEAELRTMEVPKTKPGGVPAETSGEAIDLSESGRAAMEFFRFAEQVAAGRAAEEAAAESAPAPATEESATPVIRRGGSTGGGSTFGAGSGCQVIDGVRRC